jgi:hypothetical protein
LDNQIQLLFLTDGPRNSDGQQGRKSRPKNHPREPSSRRPGHAAAAHVGNVTTGAAPWLDCPGAGERRPGRRWRRVLQRRRQALAVLDLDLEPHPRLALRAAVSLREEVVGSLNEERDGHCLRFLGAAAVD